MVDVKADEADDDDDGWLVDNAGVDARVVDDGGRGLDTNVIVGIACGEKERPVLARKAAVPDNFLVLGLNT